ncbi:hypothetical protein HYW75_05105 [Candidatus Pacearchaeota archaeon]|nr:hypothetical protein [Candidatus Pacearchaeota archaeon]
MGIKVEFNSELALRKYGNSGRDKEQSLPKKLRTGEIYKFLKEGQRNYWFEGEVPLCETDGNQNLSRPLAAIRILEATHLMLEGRIFTRGKYQITEIFNIRDSEIHFEGMQRIKTPEVVRALHETLQYAKDYLRKNERTLIRKYLNKFVIIQKDVGIIDSDEDKRKLLQRSYQLKERKYIFITTINDLLVWNEGGEKPPMIQ